MKLLHEQTMLAAILLIAGLVVGYYVVTAIYCVTAHPLANVPGPKLCAFSRIPYWLMRVRGEDVDWMKKLHDQYGPMLRFGPTDVSYTVAQAWQEIYGPRVTEKPLDFNLQPINGKSRPVLSATRNHQGLLATCFLLIRRTGVPNMLTLPTEEHSRVRRLFLPAFSDRALKQQEPMFRKYVDLLMYKLGEVGEGGSKPVEMTQLLNFTTFDVMAELCFGENLGMLAKNEYSPWVRSIFQSLQMLSLVSIINYYPLLKAFFDRFEPKAINEQRVTHCRYAEERVNKRLQSGSENPDVWNLVLNAEATDKGLTIEEMHSNAELFMLAGSETTGR